MASWLGFSLSAQEVLDHPQNSSVHHHPHLGFNSSSLDEQLSAAGAQISAGSSDQSCFDHLSSDSPIPSLNHLPAPFGILEAFNRNTHTQDWNVKDDVSMNSFSCSSQPKLENFLGHSFADHQEKNLCNNYQLNNGYNIYQETDQAAATSHTNTTTGGGNNSTIGLSMIKNWLRNNPAPPPENKSGDESSEAPPPAGPQTLSLSMSTGSQSSPPLPLLNGNAVIESCASDGNKDGQSGGAVESVPRKSVDTFGQRTSIYRGVTRHRWTGRYEAHLWDNSCRREGQTRKGRQVYLGGYDKEEKGARAYDLAALKYWGTTTTTNFPISNYEKEIEDMKYMTRQEYVASLRRKSSGFSRGASIYRGVTRHHQHGRWQARIGRVAGNKDLYLGTFSTQEEAAEAYDIAAIKFRGLNAVTNFEINRYDVKSILESSTLPIGGAAKRLKDAENAEMALEMHRANEGNNLNLQMTDHGHMNMNGYGHGWPSTIAFQQSHPSMAMYPYAHQRQLWCKQEQDFNNHEINHQLQLGNNTQNFLQPNSVLHNVMSTMESSSIEHSSGGSNNGVVYGNNGDHGNGYVMPMMGSTTVVIGDENDEGNNGFHVGNDQGMFGSTADAYQQARNLYYHQSPSVVEKASPNSYDNQGTNCNNWIPTAVPTLTARTNTMAVFHGAPTFTVWNDT